MIVGIGLDITDLKRIRKLYEDKADRFLQKIYSPEEIKTCLDRKDPIPGLAARFAAKEAFSKCLGLGWGGKINWSDVAVINDEKGKPELLLRNNAKEATIGKKIWVSLTHTEEYAAATVILEEAD